MIRRDQVVDLQEVYAPLPVEFEQGVQVGLRPGMAHLQPVRQVRPSADVPRVRNFLGAERRALDGQIRIAGPPVDSPHDVKSELHALAVNVVRQRPKTLAVGGRGKALPVRDEAAVGVAAIDAVGARLRAGFLLVPPVVDEHAAVSGRRQPLRHHRVNAAFDHVFIFARQVVAARGVPAHRRRLGRQMALAGFRPGTELRIQDQAESTDVESGLALISPSHGIVAPRRGTAADGIVGPAAAAEHSSSMHDCRRGIRGIAAIRRIAVKTPLTHISMHIVESPGVRLFAADVVRASSGIVLRAMREDPDWRPCNRRPRRCSLSDHSMP